MPKITRLFFESLRTNSLPPLVHFIIIPLLALYVAVFIPLSISASIAPLDSIIGPKSSSIATEIKQNKVTRCTNNKNGECSPNGKGRVCVDSTDCLEPTRTACREKGGESEDKNELVCKLLTGTGFDINRCVTDADCKRKDEKTPQCGQDVVGGSFRCMLLPVGTSRPCVLGAKPDECKVKHGECVRDTPDSIPRCLQFIGTPGNDLCNYPFNSSCNKPEPKPKK